MTRYAVPFGASYDPEDPPAEYEPGYALALAASQGDRDAGTNQDVQTPWGTLRVEDRGQAGLVGRTPAHEVATPRIMTTVAAMRLGLDRNAVEDSDMPIQVMDVGRAVLVVPVAELEQAETADAEADLSSVPGVDAAGGIVYTRTQRTPYVKLKGKLIGEAEPLSALAAAALHLVLNLGVRPTYPRTRVVAELVGSTGEAECTVQANKAGHEPDIQALFIGGQVQAEG